MGFLLDLLSLPVLGPLKMVHWIARTTTEQSEREYFDEGRVRGELLELQQRYEVGEIGEDEYDQMEKVLLRHLKAIMEFKAGKDSPG